MEEKRLQIKRWQLMLGEEGDDRRQDGESNEYSTGSLYSDEEKKADQVLKQLYIGAGEKSTLGHSTPKIQKWLEDIEYLFPDSVVEILHQDALEKYKIRKLLLNERFIEAVKPSAQLISTLLSFKNKYEDQALQNLRRLIIRFSEELQEKIKAQYFIQRNTNKGVVRRLKSFKAEHINWDKTILNNLKHYQIELKTVIPEHFYGHNRKKRKHKKLIILVDQSASMADSVVYSGVMASILDQLKTIETKFIVFDTQVIDLSEFTHDCVDLLLKIQLGGGTFISQALQFAFDQCDDPSQSIIIIISDLFEGGSEEQLIRLIKEFQLENLQMIYLLALNDSGKPVYNKGLAASIASLDLPCFACTPEHFPTLVAQAINGEPLEIN